MNRADLIQQATTYLSVLNDAARRREGAQLIEQLLARVRELEAGLTWTDAKPTVPGWYWWRDIHWTEPIHVIKLRGELGIPGHEIGDVDPFPAGQFAGPIPAPKEKPCST